MNEMSAHSRRALGGWVGEYRFSHKNDFYQVMDGDRPKLFSSPQSAELAAHRAILKHVNGTLVRLGDPAKMAAERAFDAIFTKGKRIPVEVKGKRRVEK